MIGLVPAPSRALRHIFSQTRMTGDTAFALILASFSLLLLPLLLLLLVLLLFLLLLPVLPKLPPAVARKTVQHKLHDHPWRSCSRLGTCLR
ncbi:unnamed protein product [Prorocentrum cordatum]|uniref:Uncharacterized protein n=1 Tax=Prorocentrum cordatum TaxID=2364126 RepID=A0ABN9SAM3_9DINO|nr:unnamed protein product [Polarella glacialis]